MKLVCLHGFLGSSKDFSFLESQFDVHAPNINDFLDLSIPEIYNKLNLNSENILIGYSFGARLAMQLFLENPDSFKKVFLFAGHMGLDTKKEREERHKFENMMISFIKNNSINSFQDMWNSLDLFKYDNKIEIPNLVKKEILIKYFKNFGLSKQPSLKKDLLRFKDKILVYYGSLDSKYCEYSKHNLSEFNVDYFSNTGHRLLDKKEIIMKIIRNNI